MPLDAGARLLLPERSPRPVGQGQESAVAVDMPFDHQVAGARRRVQHKALLDGIAACRGEIVRRGESSESRGNRRQRHRNDRNAATVAVPWQGAHIDIAHVAQGVEPALLHRVFTFDITGSLFTHETGRGQHAAVFARAIVVNSSGSATVGEHSVCGRFVVRKVRPALER